MILQEKPKQIEAVQFTGGLDSAREVIEFAFVRGYVDSAYMPEILDDGNQVSGEYVVICANLRSDSVYKLGKNSWFVVDTKNGSRMARTDDLFALYEPAKTTTDDR